MKTNQQESQSEPNLARRSFLKYAGAGVASVGLLGLASSCHKDHNVNPRGIDIGSGDTGILNYAYALEQLEAAFYTQVILSPYTGMSSIEKEMLTEIRDHEICHREFFKAVLKGNAIPALTVDFSKINFSDRTSVLGAAKAFEDTGVNAYDGAGYLIQNADYLTIAGKIVSVEARHAAYIRDLVKAGDFAGPDVVSTTTGLNTSLTIAEVLPIANTYLKTKVSASHYNYIAS